MGRSDAILECYCTIEEGCWYPCPECFAKHEAFRHGRTETCGCAYCREHQEPPELECDFCSRCNDHADYYKQDGEWLSRCCDAPPVEVDPT